MIKTFKELMKLNSAISEIMKEHPELKNSKFTYAYNKFYEKNVADIAKQYNEVLTDIRIRNAMEDPVTKELMTDPANPRGFKFDREGWIKMLKEESIALETFNIKELEVEPYFAENYPTDISEEQKEALLGLIIEE